MVFAIINVIVVKHLGGVDLEDGAAIAARLFQHPRRLGTLLFTRYAYPAQLAAVHSAGGERRGHRADAAPAQRRQAAGHRQAGGGARQGSGPDRQDGLREKTMITLTHVLALSGILFAIAVAGVFLNRKNIIVLLMCIELMLLAVNFNFVAFSRFLGDISGQVFVFFILTVAAAEAAIGLAILVVLFRERSTIDVEDLDTLQG